MIQKNWQTINNRYIKISTIELKMVKRQARLISLTLDTTFLLTWYIILKFYYAYSITAKVTNYFLTKDYFEYFVK